MIAKNMLILPLRDFTAKGALLNDVFIDLYINLLAVIRDTYLFHITAQNTEMEKY